MDWVILAVLSAVFLTGVDIVWKKALKREHSLEMLTVTMITVVALQLLLIPFISLKISLYYLIISAVRGLLVGVAVLFFTRAMHHMEISSVVPVKNLTPLILLFLSTIFLGEIISVLQIIGICLIVIGTYFLQIHNHYLDIFKHLKEAKNKYFYFALAGAVLFAISAMITRAVVTEIPPTTYLFYSNIFICAYYIASTFIHYDGMRDIKYGFSQGKYWVPLGAVFMLSADLLYFRAASIPAAYIALILPIRRLSTLFSVILGGRMFHDHFLVNKIISTVIVLAGIIMIVFG